MGAPYGDVLPPSQLIVSRDMSGARHRCFLRFRLKAILTWHRFPNLTADHENFPVGSTLKCPVFIAHDLSGFAFPSALTEGARRATEVSAENRRAPSPQVTPCLVLDRSLGFRAGNPSAEKAATRCGP